MGFLDRILGREPEPADTRSVPDYGTPPGAPRDARTERSDDEIAIERYRYLLRTAPPETIEQVHEEAFSRLTPEQRAQVFQEHQRPGGGGAARRGRARPGPGGDPIRIA
jgi:hypothetical protein